MAGSSSETLTETTTRRPLWEESVWATTASFVQDLESVPFTAPTDLQGRKSYFLVGDQVLALGSHISGGTAADETHTTIFQTRWRAPTP